MYVCVYVRPYRRVLGLISVIKRQKWISFLQELFSFEVRKKKTVKNNENLLVAVRAKTKAIRFSTQPHLNPLRVVGTLLPTTEPNRRLRRSGSFDERGKKKQSKRGGECLGEKTVELSRPEPSFEVLEVLTESEKKN